MINLEPHIQATHDKIAQEKETLLQRFRSEFAHEPKKDNGKLDRVLDSMIGEAKRGRGRPKGSKNKPKPELVKPSLIGHVPQNDLILLRRD